MQWKRPSWMTDERIELLLDSKKGFNKAVDALSRYGKVTDFSVTTSVYEPARIDLSIEPYSARIDADGRVQNSYEKLNKACEEINRNLTKSILDKYDLNYIDTDMAATTYVATKEEFGNHIKEAYKNYILEGKKMPTGGYSRLFDNDVTFVPTRFVPKVKKIIHSGPCTIVFWEDNTKTIVRLEEGKEYDEYAAFTAALAKKCYGSNSKVHKILEKKTKRDLKEKIKNAKTVDLFPDIPEEKKRASREAAIKRRDGEL